jgi:hypothetical protein
MDARRGSRAFGDTSGEIAAEMLENCMVRPSAASSLVNYTDWRGNRPIGSPPSRQLSFRGLRGAAMFGLARIMRGQRKLWLGAGLSIASTTAFAGPVCVTCAKPGLNIQCEIRKSQSLEGLPFAEKLIAGACVKAVKASSGASACHVAKDAVCPNWPLRSFSLKEAKRALLGETRAAPKAQDPLAKAVADPPTETKWAPLYRPIATAWQKFLAIITWR